MSADGQRRVYCAFLLIGDFDLFLTSGFDWEKQVSGFFTQRAALLAILIHSSELCDPLLSARVCGSGHANDHHEHLRCHDSADHLLCSHTSPREGSSAESSENCSLRPRYRKPCSLKSLLAVIACAPVTRGHSDNPPPIKAHTCPS